MYDEKERAGDTARFNADFDEDGFFVTPEVESLTREILSSSGHLSQDKAISVRRVDKSEDSEQDIRPERYRKKRRRHTFVKVFMIILLIIVSAGSYELIRLKSIANSINYTSHVENVSPTETIIDKAYIQANVSHSDTTKNILLIGSDVDKNGISRSDSMIILSLDHEHRKIKLTSLMRDMYLDIPNNGKHKLNAAFTFGGPELLMRTVYVNFGLEPDNYVCVDYNAFATIVDKIGGIEITVEKDELEQFNKYVSGGAKNKINEAGTYNLNGKQALAYCRIRKVGSDTERTARQRRVLHKIIEKCADMNYFKLESLMAEVAPMITTDFTQTQMLHMLAECFVSTDYDTMQMRIPVDGSWNGKTIGGVWYMKFDLPSNARDLNDFIYGDDKTAISVCSYLNDDK